MPDLIELPHTPGCLVCGPSNTFGLKLTLFVDPSTGMVHVDFSPRAEHIGFEGIAHGGMLATVLDEAMVWAATWNLKRFCVCGELSTRFRRPARVGEQLHLEAKVELSRPKLVQTVATIRTPDHGIVAAASGKYVPMDDEKHEAVVASFIDSPNTEVAAARFPRTLNGGKLPRVLNDIFNTIDARKEQSLALLKEFLRIPSVSTKPEHAADMTRCANFLVNQLTPAGFDAWIMPTDGHPAVVAKNKHEAGRPTVLVYGHYDVQPAEPLDLWTSPPFDPTVRNNALYGRGTCDDKGQVWCHVDSLLTWQKHGGVPVNVTLLIEGEEEIGSKNLRAFVKKHKDALKADIAVVSDTNQFSRGVPAITYGLRGLAYMEVKITAAASDLHSGYFGGTVANPANELCKLLGSLVDADGHITIDEFYEDVVPLTAKEREEWAKLPFDEAAYAKELGVPQTFGEKEFTSTERRWARPTCDINGLTSGYQGPGAKTVLPCVATAKISMRLVPNQDPAKVIAGFEKTLRARCPKTVKMEITCHSSTPAVLVPTDSKAIRLAADALEAGFGKKPAYMREGGSIPVVQMFKQELGIDTLLVGFGLPDDNIHAPNEKFDLDALHLGTKTCAALYEKLAQL